jgi:hypothetical protein
MAVYLNTIFPFYIAVQRMHVITMLRLTDVTFKALRGNLTRIPTSIETVIIIRSWLFYYDRKLNVFLSILISSDSASFTLLSRSAEMSSFRQGGMSPQAKGKTSRFLPAIILFLVPSLIFSTSSPNWPSSPLLVAYRTRQHRKVSLAIKVEGRPCRNKDVRAGVFNRKTQQLL